MTLLRLYLVLLIVGVGGGPPVAWAQAPDSTEEAPSEVVERVTAAFGEGDAERLLAPSADRVEVNLFGSRTIYSSAQAFYVLRDFFRSHVPREFAIEDVTEAGTNCFVRGIYEQAQVDQPLQIYVRLDQEEEDVWHLREVRIEIPTE